MASSDERLSNLATSHESEIGTLSAKVDRLQHTMNALGQQTAERFALMDRRLTSMDERFRGIDGQFAQLRTGMGHITGMLQTLIDRK